MNGCAGSFHACAFAPGAHSIPLDLTHDLFLHSQVQRLVNVNLVFGIALTTGILNGGMQSAPGQKAILFMGSAAGMLAASPLVAVYAAAKSGIASVAGSLASECARESVAIDVMCCTPGNTMSGNTLNWWGGDGWVPPYDVPALTWPLCKIGKSACDTLLCLNESSVCDRLLSSSSSRTDIILS